MEIRLMAAIETIPTNASPTNGVLSEDALFEIIDGVRVEKVMGARELLLANVLAGMIKDSLGKKPAGLAVVEMLFRLKPGSSRARCPDVAYVPYELWPERDIQEDEAWEIVPPLMVEIISPSNRANEIKEKIEEYFANGVRQVWIIYPRQRGIHVYTGPKSEQILDAGDFLEGGDLLPSFRISVGELLPPRKSNDPSSKQPPR
jgi:Uma2 family endonuclease